MRIDVHTHIFPPEVVSGRESHFASEPAFELLYGSPRAKLVTAETLLESMDKAGVDRSVVFGFPWVQTELSARHNDYVLEAASRHSPRLIPLACMNPLARESVREAERCLKAGARGLGELAVYEDYSTNDALKRYRDIVECCREFDGILLIHANEPVGHKYPGKAPFGLDFYYDIAKMAAGMDLILAHWGGGLCFYELLKKEAPETLQRVYYDTAASPFLYQPSMYSLMVRALGKGKVLLGTDFPLLGPERYYREMEEAGLTPEEIRAVSGENAMRLFE